MTPDTTTQTTTITTQDGLDLSAGDRAFNYYDHLAGTIEKIDDRAQPDTMAGQSSATPQAEWSNHWFDFRHDNGSRTSLDGSRICSIAYATRRGWIAADEIADRAAQDDTAARNSVWSAQ